MLVCTPVNPQDYIRCTPVRWPRLEYCELDVVRINGGLPVAGLARLPSWRPLTGLFLQDAAQVDAWRPHFQSLPIFVSIWEFSH